MREARDFLNEDQQMNSQGTAMDDDLGRILQVKWKPMLEGIDDPWMRRSMAVIFENEMKHVATLRGKLTESSLSQNVPDLVKFIFPLIRKVWANLIANNLVSIQPMSSPIGGIFYWDYKYGTTKGQITAGDNMIENFDRNYSSEFIDDESYYSGAGTANTNATMEWKPVQPYTMGRDGIVFTATRTGGGILTCRDADGSGTLTGDIAAGAINFTTGVTTIQWDQSDVVDVKASYFFVMEGISANVPEVNVDIQLDPVKAWSRKLKILWSSEAADDMRAVLNMDIEPELTAGVASEIALGIDRELIMSMYTSGTTNIEAFDAAVPPGRTQVDHYRNITTVLGKVSGEINRRTHRGPGNFLVIGPSVQPIFEALATHGDLRAIFTDPAPLRTGGQGVTGRPAFALPQAPSGYGVYAMGMLQSKWTVVVDPYFPVGKILVGLKGPLFPDSGLVYAPYVALEMTSAFLDPSDFTLRKGMRTRYAKKMTNKNFYGIITVTNLP